MPKNSTENAVFDIVEKGWLIDIDWTKVDSFRKYKETVAISSGLAEDIKFNKNNIRAGIEAVFIPVYNENQKVRYDRLV